MINILHILDDNQLGGVTRLLHSLVTSLADAGHHHRLVATTKHRLAPPLDIMPQGARPDVIVVHFTASWAKLGFLETLRLRAPKARIVLVEHSYTAAFEQRCVQNTSRFRVMLRLSYRCADEVIAVSHGQAMWLEKARLVDKSKLTVIPCVLDLSAFAAIPDVVMAPDRPMRLGAFGRFAPQKGFDTLIEAMRRVPAHVATLDLAGYGPDEVALRRQAEGLAHVRIQGRVDPVQFLEEIDAVAMPSRWEAGAVTCWEVRAAGRPMIVADVDGLPEQISTEIGLVVPPEDPAALASSICKLAHANRTEMSVIARKTTDGAYVATLAAWRALLARPINAQLVPF